MAQNNNSGYSASTHEPEQVDLIALCIQLWRGKGTIILCVALALVISVAYLFVAKEKWTSSAIITQPDAGQIAGYTNVLSVLYGENAPTSDDMQQQLIQRFNAAFSALGMQLANQKTPALLTIDSVDKKAPKPDDVAIVLPLKATYTGHSAQEAQQKLANYIRQTDTEVLQGLKSDLAVDIASREKALKATLAAQEKVAVERKAQRLAQITQALTIARQSGIKLPKVLQAENLSPETMFLLGSDALTAMVNNEASRPLAFSDDYYQTRQNLLAISAFSGLPDNLRSYRYVMQPTLPVRRDSPKRALTLALAALLGAMLGAGVVLGRNALRGYRGRV